MRFTEKLIPIKGRNEGIYSVTDLQITATVATLVGLAYHRSVDYGVDCWRITHLASGMCLSNEIPLTNSQEYLQQLIVELSKLVDWKLSEIVGVSKADILLVIDKLNHPVVQQALFDERGIA